MKGRPIDELVYEYMFPRPRSGDPQNFHSFIHRHLILEVRQEVHAFYGHLDNQEAKYPGLDYSHRIHRIRLSRWPWHRRLFRAFDGLRLTTSEIGGLTKWEGTKWAKERYERDSGETIIDTADEGFPEWVEPDNRPRATRAILREEPEELEDDAEAADEDMDGEEDSDGELESVGISLNERLRARAARHEAGDTSQPLDEEWEQWLKMAIEEGHIPFDLPGQIVQQYNDMTLIPQALLPPRMVAAARAGRWNEVPEYIHEMLRRTIGTEARSSDRSTPDSSSSPIPIGVLHSSSRRTLSDLRLPLNDGGNSRPSGSATFYSTAPPRA